MANWVKNDSSFEAIPIIDITPLVIHNDNSKSLQKTVNEIRDACKYVGFYYIKTHQIPKDHLSALNHLVEEFFYLPLEEKMKIHISKSDIFRGYTPVSYTHLTLPTILLV